MSDHIRSVLNYGNSAACVNCQACGARASLCFNGSEWYCTRCAPRSAALVPDPRDAELSSLLDEIARLTAESRNHRERGDGEHQEMLDERSRAEAAEARCAALEAAIHTIQIETYEAWTEDACAAALAALPPARDQVGTKTPDQVEKPKCATCGGSGFIRHDGPRDRGNAVGLLRGLVAHYTPCPDCVPGPSREEGSDAAQA